jgi:predicted transcriptional regulator
MARGTALTECEKWAITAMVEAGLSITKIANKTARSETVVRKYIDENLSNVRELNAKENGFIPKDVEKAVYDKLLEGGMAKMDAVACIKYMKSKLTEPTNLGHVDYLVGVAQKKINPGALLTRQSEGGRKGVVIMNKVASENMDKIRAARITNKNVDDHIFRQEHAAPKGLENE